MNTTLEISKAKELVSLGDKNQMVKLEAKHLLTPEDSDEFKLPILESLLLKMHEFVRVMKTKSIDFKKIEKNYIKRKGYVLTSPEYSDQCSFDITLESNWFDAQKCLEINTGFNFFLSIKQEVYPGFGDYIKIGIRHFPTNPFALASSHEYDGNKSLKMYYKGKKFFENFQFEPGERKIPGLGGNFSFKKDAFEKAVNDICVILDFLIVNNMKIEESE